MNWQTILVREKTRFQKGIGEANFIRYFIFTFAIIDVWITVKLSINLPLWIYFPLFLGAMFGFWFVGRAWDYFELYEYETEFSNMRNKLAKEMRRFIKKNGKRDI